MLMIDTLFQTRSSRSLMFALFLAVPACSAAAGGETQGTFAQGTGELVAMLPTVPADVRCIQITTTDWRTSMVFADVEPGSMQTIRIGPLNSGTVWLQGVAHSSVCAEANSVNQTWVADQATAWVDSGRTGRATLTFRRLGRLDVTVDFEHCNPDAGNEDGGSPCSDDGIDAGVWRTE